MDNLVTTTVFDLSIWNGKFVIFHHSQKVQLSTNPKNKAFLALYFSTFDINTTVSTVLPKTHKAPDSYINVSVDFGNSVGMIPLNSIIEKAEAYKPKQRITYKLIKHSGDMSRLN